MTSRSFAGRCLSIACLQVILGCGKGDAGIENVSADARPIAKHAQASGETSEPAARDAGGEDDEEPDELTLPDRPNAKEAKNIDFTYKIAAQANSFTVCDGTIHLKSNPKFDVKTILSGEKILPIDIPEGKIDCGLMGDINVGCMLNGFLGELTKGSNLADPSGGLVVVENNVVKVRRLKTTKYDKPRPLIVNFLAKDFKKLASAGASQSLTATDERSNKSGSGTVSVRVTGTSASSKKSGISTTFKNVVRFTTEVSGFANLDPLGNFLLDHIELEFSRKPIALLGVQVRTGAAGFLNVDPSAGGLTPEQQAKLNEMIPACSTGLFTMAPALASLGGGGGGGGEGGLFSDLANKVAKFVAEKITVKFSLELIGMGENAI